MPMMQTELHRHLDVSTRPQTLLSLAQERGLVSQSTSLEEFRRDLVLTEPLADLNAVLAKFTLFQKVLDRPEVLERLAFEALEDCWNEGTRWVEFRYSPTFVSEFGKLSWAESLSAFRRGLAQGLYLYPEMRAGLICIASRNYGAESVDQTIEFFLNNFDSFIGVDLAGEEKDFPCRLFTNSFKKVIARGANITIHAGEGAGPESIWEAIQLLGAHRIGHGVACVRDRALMEHLADQRICLEMCPTSNWLTQAVPSLAEHPLPKILRAGIPVSINTDDPGIMGVTLPHEIQVCRDLLGLSLTEIERCGEYAKKASFLQFNRA